MTIGCNIWIICLKLNWFFYGLSCMLQFSEFVWAPSYSVWDVFNKFLLIDATDRSTISSDQKRLFIALSLSLSFFANTPFKVNFDPNSHVKIRDVYTWKLVVVYFLPFQDQYHCWGAKKHLYINSFTFKI